MTRLLTSVLFSLFVIAPLAMANEPAPSGDASAVTAPAGEEHPADHKHGEEGHKKGKKHDKKKKKAKAAEGAEGEAH